MGFRERRAACTHSETTLQNTDGGEVCCLCGAEIGRILEPIEWVPGIGDVRERATVSYESDADCDHDPSGGHVHKSWTHRATRGRNKVYREGKKFIRSVCDDLQLSCALAHEALSIFRVVRTEHGRWRGARRIGVMIACISLACQKLSVGISDRDILENPRVKQPRKTMNAQKKVVLQLLHERLSQQISQPKASEFCFRICALMGIHHPVDIMVSVTCDRLSSREHLQARSCSVIVAVSLLYVSEKHDMSINISRLCECVHVTRPTLTKWYAEAMERDMSASRQMLSQIDSSCPG